MHGYFWHRLYISKCELLPRNVVAMQAYHSYELVLKACTRFTIEKKTCRLGLNNDEPRSSC